MQEQEIKIRRSTIAIKMAMVVVVLMEASIFYQTNTLNFGSLAFSLGILSLLRGLLLSPLLFQSPIRHWFKKNIGTNSDSYKYFTLSFVLILIGIVRYF